MMPVSRPCAKLMLTSSSTTWYPKRLCRCVASNIFAQQSSQPFGLEKHDEHEEKPVPEKPRLCIGAEQIARDEEQHRAEHRAPERNQPAAHQSHHHHEARLLEAHHVRIGRLLRERE